MLVSVTSLSSYLYCQRKLFLEGVLRIIEIPKEAVVKGTIRHESYDGINKAEEELVKSITPEKLKDLDEIYKDRYSKILRKVINENTGSLKSIGLNPSIIFKETWPLILKESASRADNIKKFIKINDVFGDELWEKLTPKIISEYRLESEALGLKGIVDQIAVYENELVPFELKTGKCPREGVWPGHKIQIASYMLMLKEKSEKKISEGIIKYLDHDLERQILLNPFIEEEVRALVRKVNMLFNSLEIPGHCDNENKCNACNLKEKCHDANFIREKMGALRSKSS